MTSKYFNPHKSFLSLKIIRFTVGFFCTLAVISVCIIIFYSYSKLEKDLSFSGFNFALTVFKVPLSILALIIPTVALFAANHRSEQTKEQMRLANVQNNFANYYKHREEFENFCEKDIENSKNRIYLPLKFHTLVFPKATEGDYSISENFIKEVNDDLIKILKISKILDVKDFRESDNITKDSNKKLNDFSSKYYIGDYRKMTSFSESCSNMRKFGDTLQIVIIVIRDALRFDPSYEPSELITQIIEFNTLITDIPIKRPDKNADLQILINKINDSIDGD